MNIDIQMKDGFDNMIFTDVTNMLSQASWSKGIGIDEVKQCAENSSLVVGAFCADCQVSYARVISDKTRFAYIADVYVDEKYRHNGIAQTMMQYILSHESLKDVYQWVLLSAANELYEKVGFAPFPKPEKWMAIMHERPQR